MLSASTLKYLKDLAAHNERDWFQDTKPRFEKAKEEFEEFIEFLIHGISEFDASVKGLEAKRCIFRIHRDVRFSKDKSPYKTHFGAHIGAFASQVHDRAGYYVHIEPQNSMLGGGAYQPPPPWLAAIREAIDSDGAALNRILASASFKKYFGALEGETLKTTPKGYPPDHRHIDLLRHKGFLAVHRPTDTEIVAPNFPKHVLQVFKALKPFDDYLNAALKD